MLTLNCTASRMISGECQRTAQEHHQHRTQVGINIIGKKALYLKLRSFAWGMFAHSLSEHWDLTSRYTRLHHFPKPPVATQQIWDIIWREGWWKWEDPLKFLPLDQKQPLGKGKEIHQCFFLSCAPTSISPWLSLEQLESPGNNPLGLRWMSESALTLHEIVSCYLLMQQLLFSSH